jgi:hypothetical protein
MTKRLAVQFYGYLRTFRRTFDSFVKNVLEPNRACGYEIDVFIHTWDTWEYAVGTYQTWHITEKNPGGANSSIAGRPVTGEDRKWIEEHYAPKRWEAVTQQPGQKRNDSLLRVSQLRKEYEQQTGTQYDWVITTRPDVRFLTPLIIDDYLGPYNGFHIPFIEYNPLRSNLLRMYSFGLPEDPVFSSNNIFATHKVYDPRFIYEADLIWFARPDSIYSGTPPTYMDGIQGDNDIMILYYLYRDFDICRADTQKTPSKWWQGDKRKLHQYEIWLRWLVACCLPTRKLREKLLRK